MEKITEGMGIHTEWAKEVKEMTMQKLPAFIKKLTEDYSHDYGTICHAIACAAIATANAVNRSDIGGISGFQAGAVQWEMIKLWGVFEDGPKQMINYDDMLYPQYEENFKTITPEVWAYLQEKAKENLLKDAVPRVKAHWKTIADGQVPFGYTVSS